MFRAIFLFKIQKLIFKCYSTFSNINNICFIYKLELTWNHFGDISLLSSLDIAFIWRASFLCLLLLLRILITFWIIFPSFPEILFSSFKYQDFPLLNNTMMIHWTKFLSMTFFLNTLNITAFFLSSGMGWGSQFQDFLLIIIICTWIIF